MAKIHDIDVDDYLKNCVALEPTAISEEYTRTPADIAYWNACYARAYKDFLSAKINRERVEARIHLELREKAKAAPDDKRKGPTVDDIKAAVTCHPEVVAAQEAEILAEVEKVKLFGALDAVRSKRDMVVQLGAQYREEMKNDPVLREQSLGHRRAREG